MKTYSAALIALSVLASSSLFAQEEEKPKGEAQSMMMPVPLTDNEFYRWMVGEWEGLGSSPFGKTKEWQRVEWALGNQFVVTRYTSKTIEMSEEQVKAAAEMMHMSKEDVEKMKDMTYEGMGLMTLNPMTREYVGYWFDNWRGMYKGTGKLEGGTLTLTWEGPTGSEVRTIEKVDNNKMVSASKEKTPAGSTIETRTEMTRKK